jgi:hypothetical protein
VYTIISSAVFPASLTESSLLAAMHVLRLVSAGGLNWCVASI